jgi:hypothetical protein
VFLNDCSIKYSRTKIFLSPTNTAYQPVIKIFIPTANYPVKLFAVKEN